MTVFLEDPELSRNDPAELPEHRAPREGQTGASSPVNGVRRLHREATRLAGQEGAAPAQQLVAGAEAAGGQPGSCLRLAPDSAALQASPSSSPSRW